MDPRRTQKPAVLAWIIAALLVAALQVGPVVAAPAKPPAKGAAPAAGADDKDKPFQDWSKVLKDASKHEGFFTVHRKRDNLYLEIRPDQLEKPLLGIFSASASACWWSSGTRASLPPPGPRGRRRRP
jgi:hypothetical protein